MTCLRCRVPASAVMTDWMVTRYISCRQTSFCNGSTYKGPEPLTAKAERVRARERLGEGEQEQKMVAFTGLRNISP